MQIGFNAPTSGPLIEPDSLSRIIVEGENLGFDYVTISDHIMVPRNLDSKYPYTDSGEFPAGTQAAWLDQLATTAWIAAMTKKLRFVLSVMVVPYRPAVLTAKLLSTIDFLSKGRLTCGIGVGWCKEEFEALSSPPFDERGAVTDEWMAACMELWTADEPKFAGKYTKFDDVQFTPKPAQSPIPIWVGGESGPALRRTGWTWTSSRAALRSLATSSCCARPGSRSPHRCTISSTSSTSRPRPRTTSAWQPGNSPPRREALGGRRRSCGQLIPPR